MIVVTDVAMKFAGFVFVISCLFLPLDNKADNVNAYEYLNSIRKQAGMSAFTFNEQLANAAQNHSIYLHTHRLGGHGEQYGREGYTGQRHVDRIHHTGYLSSQTGENVSYHTGNKCVKQSVDGLMSAIYHRFAFLSFKYDEAGIGSSQSQVFSAHVYNFGNQRKNALCRQASYTLPGRYHYEVCADQRLRIATPELENAEYLVSKTNGDVIVWPGENSKDIPPAFYEEAPDPLPDYDVSGYPVSIQFNPAAFPQGLPVVTRFQLFRVSDNKPLEIITQMHAGNDRNRKFKPNEHALFPLHRLDWDTQYRAEADYQVAGQQQTRNWTFTTSKMTLPMVTMTEENPRIRVKSGETFAIYVPPRDTRDGKGVYRTRFPHGMNLDIQIHDNHTLIVTVTGRPGDATVTFHGLDIQLLMLPDGVADS